MELLWLTRGCFTYGGYHDAVFLVSSAGAVVDDVVDDATRHHGGFPICGMVQSGRPWSHWA